MCVKLGRVGSGILFWSVSLAQKNAQQSVHLTGGILWHFQALSTPKQNPALEVLSTPAHPQVTQAVSWLRIKKGMKLWKAKLVSLS
jgi:hypothetical protein